MVLSWRDAILWLGCRRCRGSCLSAWVQGLGALLVVVLFSLAEGRRGGCGRSTVWPSRLFCKAIVACLELLPVPSFVLAVFWVWVAVACLFCWVRLPAWVRGPALLRSGALMSFGRRRNHGLRGSMPQIWMKVWCRCCAAYLFLPWLFCLRSHCEVNCRSLRRGIGPGCGSGAKSVL